MTNIDIGDKNMTQQRSVSLPDKMDEFVDEQGLSPSKILQNEIKERMPESELEVKA